MDKGLLKKVIKPIIRECLTEILLEEGLKSFSNKEVVKENTKKQELVEQKVQNKTKIDYNKVFNKEIIEKNKKLGFDLSSKEFDPFKGTISADILEKMEPPHNQKVSNLINEGAGEWSRILNAMKAGK